eukprot:jgi/Chrzof1/12461/Cz06g35060.t1_DGAT2F[v5.2]
MFAGLLAMYIAYIWGPGMQTCEGHSWGAPLRRNERWQSMWLHMADYFNAQLIKTADLDPHGKYVFACYPHGISALSGWINFATEATGFSKLFPGITTFPMTLSSNFKSPLVREYCLLNGLRSCSRKGCSNLLRKEGNAVVLFPGGAAEALLMENGKHKLVLNKRKGFVRIALQSGASLVPVYAFGETDTFTTHIPPPGSLGCKLQNLSHKYWGTSQPIFSGVGLFTQKGLIPYSTPLTTVVGAPIPVPKFEGDTATPEFEALVDMYHERYVKALLGLWEAYKDEFAKDRKGELTIVE